MGWDAEVIVVGGGLAGSATALAFSRAGHDVIVLERGQFPRSKVCGEGLFPNGVAALRRYGVVPPAGSRPFLGIRFSSGEVTATGRFPHGEVGVGLRRTDLDALLFATASQAPRVQVRQHTIVRGVTRERDGWTVHTATGTVRAPLLVGADGLHSQVRRWVGLDRPGRGRKRYGVRAHFKLAAGATDPEWVDVFRLDGGELYVTPTAPGEINVAALCEHATMAGFKGDPTAGLLRWIASCPPLAERIGEGVDQARVCGPLRQRARAAAADGVMLVGDAAGFLDGITGEGMSLALHAAEHAARIGSEALRRGSLDARTLREYAVARARLVRDVERVGNVIVWGIRSQWLTERALRGLARRPELFDQLLAISTGRATLISGW